MYHFRYIKKTSRKFYFLWSIKPIFSVELFPDMNKSLTHLSNCKFYCGFRICDYFLIKINISEAINVFVTLDIKNLKKHEKKLKIFLLLSFPYSSLKTPNYCAFLGPKPWSVFYIKKARSVLCRKV